MNYIVTSSSVTEDYKIVDCYGTIHRIISIKITAKEIADDYFMEKGQYDFWE